MLHHSWLCGEFGQGLVTGALGRWTLGYFGVNGQRWLSQYFFNPYHTLDQTTVLHTAFSSSGIATSGENRFSICIKKFHDWGLQSQSCNSVGSDGFIIAEILLSYRLSPRSATDWWCIMLPIYISWYFIKH